MERLLTLYSEVQSTDVRWLWYPFIAIGKITLLQGDPGDGKFVNLHRYGKNIKENWSTKSSMAMNFRRAPSFPC